MPKGFVATWIVIFFCHWEDASAIRYGEVSDSRWEGAKNREKCRPLPVSSVYVQYGNRSLPTSLGHCAVVGSGSALKSKRLGPEIDAHDTVWRVNRLPLDGFEKEDLGERTDMYFKNTLGDYKDGTVKVRKIGHQTEEKGLLAHQAENMTFMCSVSRPSDSCKNSFKALFYEGADHKFIEKDAHSEVGFPFVKQADPLHYFQHWVTPLGSYELGKFADTYTYYARPSGGMKAILTALMICDSVKLYGFGGRKTVDDHVLGGHGFENEHAFQHALSQGTVHDSAFAKDWHGLYRDEFAALQSRVQCMSKNQRLLLVPE